MRIAKTTVGVKVPATSGNVGPGFDSMGLALELRDEVKVEATTGGIEVSVRGEGEGTVPAGEDHLVVRALRRALDAVGAPQCGLRMECLNRIPHGRGLGSSASAVVAGLTLAREMISEPEALDDHTLLQLASEFEGHPDNAAPAILGGVTTSWWSHDAWHATRLSVADGVLDPVILVPATRLATAKARALLPESVPHVDAAFNAGRTALLVHALGGHSELLMEATEDKLHQEYRASGMPSSLELVRVLRSEGYPTVVSGAGPTVLVMRGADERLHHIVSSVVEDPAQWRLARVSLAGTGTIPVVL